MDQIITYIWYGLRNKVFTNYHKFTTGSSPSINKLLVSCQYRLPVEISQNIWARLRISLEASSIDVLQGDEHEGDKRIGLQEQITHYKVQKFYTEKALRVWR